MQNPRSQSPTRRQFLGDMASCAGSAALAWMLNRDGAANAATIAQANASPVLPKPPHFAPKAKRVLQIFCPGGFSHLDSNQSEGYDPSDLPCGREVKPEVVE